MSKPVLNILDYTQNKSLSGGDSNAIRGWADGLAGKPVATEHPRYYEAHSSARRHAEAVAGKLVVGVMNATQCGGCGGVWVGFSLIVSCQCENIDGGARLKHGVMSIHGPREDGDPLDFYNLTELREFAARGIPMVDSNGESLYPQYFAQ